MLRSREAWTNERLAYVQGMLADAATRSVYARAGTRRATGCQPPSIRRPRSSSTCHRTVRRRHGALRRSVDGSTFGDVASNIASLDAVIGLRRRRRITGHRRHHRGSVAAATTGRNHRRARQTRGHVLANFPMRPPGCSPSNKRCSAMSNSASPTAGPSTRQGTRGCSRCGCGESSKVRRSPGSTTAGQRSLCRRRCCSRPVEARLPVRLGGRRSGHV